MGSALRITRREAAGDPHGWPEHVHPVLQRVYAARGVMGPTEADHRLHGLLAPNDLSGIECATQLLTEAITKQQHIVIAADFDCDGATGAAIAVRGLKMLGARNVGYVVPNRMLHGYGLSPALIDTLQTAPDLIITVDNGIASHAGVAAAKARGCRVIITDHHLPGASLPDADAIVNPNLASDGFASKHLCGAGVMFYLLLALRARLRDNGTFTGCDEPDLAPLLDLVALGTVADLVRLDRNNRILVEAGLRRIRAGRACAGINALIEISGRDRRRLIASDLGFSVAPRINAAGRLEDMSLGIECLLTDDVSRAHELATILNGINVERRGLQDAMTADAEAMLADIDAGGATGVTLFEPSWHQGVIGLVASKIKERLHRPVIAFAYANDNREELRGSARSIASFHVRDALAEVDAREPGLIARFGGHAMAAGLSLRAQDYERFARCFDAVARERIDPESLQPLLHSDGELVPQDFVIELAHQLRVAGPWGQGFPAPLFDNLFECAGWRRIGAEERHLRMNLRDPRDGRTHEAVMFNAPPQAPPATLRAVYELDINDWQGRESLRLLLRHVEPT